MIVIGEMSTGILVACVPTLGPVFFPDRFARSHYKYKDSGKAPLHVGSSPRKTFRGHGSDRSGERTFTSLEEDDMEFKTALHLGQSYQAHAVRASIIEEPERHVDTNAIEVRKDLDVSDSPRNEP